MPEKETEVGVIFPIAGLNTTCEFSRQPPDTTPAGVNVRTYETITDRARGGSRPGLTQFIPQLVNGVTNPIQMLNILVDPQGSALDANDGIPGPTIQDPDPRYNRLVPAGGSGVQLNLNIQTFQQTMRLLGNGAASASCDPGNGWTGALTLPVGTTPPAGSLVVVVVAVNQFATGGSGGFGITSVVDGAGNNYTQLQSAARSAQATPGPSPAFWNSTYSLWYAYVPFLNNSAATITVTPSGPDQNTLLGATASVFSFSGTTPAEHSIIGSAAYSGNTTAASGSVSNTGGVHALYFFSLGGSAGQSTVAPPGLPVPPGFTFAGLGSAGPSPPGFGIVNSYFLTPTTASGFQVPQVPVGDNGNLLESCWFAVAATFSARA